MCRRAALLAVVFGLAIESSTVSAQTRSELVQRLLTTRALADSSERAYERLSIQRDAAGAYTDSMRAGPVVVLTTRELFPLVSGVVRGLERDLSQEPGTVALLQGRRFGVRIDTTWLTLDRKRRYLTVVELTNRFGESYGGGFVDLDSAQVAAALNERIQQSMVRHGSPVFNRWHDAPLRVAALKPWEWTDVRLRLISSTDAASKQCFGGDRDACARVLRLVPVADPATALFDSASRIAVVRNSEPRARRGNPLAADQCLKGRDSACVIVVRELVGYGFGPWVTSGVRASLIHEALTLGGKGAVVRLAQSRDSIIGPALASAAGVPIDSLIGSWLAKVQSAGVESEAFNPTIALASLGWVLLLGILSLRSGRWR